MSDRGKLGVTNRLHVTDHTDMLVASFPASAGVEGKTHEPEPSDGSFLRSQALLKILTVWLHARRLRIKIILCSEGGRCIGSERSSIEVHKVK